MKILNLMRHAKSSWKEAGELKDIERTLNSRGKRDAPFMGELLKKLKVNPDLNDYATELAMQGLFTMIAKEEKNIRQDPVARTTELLRRVFGAKQ